MMKPATKILKLKVEIEQLESTVRLLNFRVSVFKKHMKDIRKLGRVCEDFEICNHNSCADSCGACLIAMEALK